jgi:TRAP transporter TAXI family solute receptor
VQTYHVITIDPNIKTIADLKGKRLGIGAVGSNSALEAMRILEKHGLNEGDYWAENLDLGESCTKMKDGHLDAVFNKTSVPSPTVNELAFSTNIHMVPLDEKVIEEWMKDDPTMSKIYVAPGMYRGVDDRPLTYGQKSMICVRPDFSEEAAYKITKVLMENQEELKAAAPVFAPSTIEDFADTVGIPLHPGAAKYFEEVLGAEGLKAARGE